MISPEDTDQDSEAVSRCLNGKEDLGHSFEVVLKDLPEVLLYIKRLNEHIKKQQYTLVRLFEKLKEYKQTSTAIFKSKVEYADASTQTETLLEEQASLNSVSSTQTESNVEDQCTEWTAATGTETGLSLADEVKKVAENAMQQTGFVYEETSGMYYDYNTGYYYNAEMGLYYDGNSGTYMYYNEGTKTYEYHSQAALPASIMTMAQVGLPDIPGVSVSEKTAEVQSVKFSDVRVKSNKAPLTVPLMVADVRKTVKSVIAVPDKAADIRVKSSKSALAQSDKVTDVRVKSTKRLAANDVTESRVKSARAILAVLDPLESEEDNLHIPGSNPMAPVQSETSKETKPDQKSSKESRNEHKRKGKHKKHKSKKRKKKRHRSLSRDNTSLEEGECSGSSGSQDEKETDYSVHMYAKENDEEMVVTEEAPPAMESNFDISSLQPWKKLRRLSDEASEAWPPCMRIIVRSTEVKNLSVGTLFIVTCKGGTLGREKFHAVSIPDINISKHHGIFNFDESNGGKYFLIDYGSRNGTYINKQRLSSAKQESDPCEIPHGTVITLGSTDLLCHIHPGRETCEECEPGVVAAKKVLAEDCELLLPSSSSGESKSEKRLQELRRLRKRFGLESNESKAELLAPGYEDRAEIRRVTVGSHNEHAKTEVASTTESIRSSNKGFKMLSKMGWKEGESLGRDGKGLTEPVLVSQRADKAGLGADHAFSATASEARPYRQRADRWQLARQRYGQLPDTVDGDADAE